MLVSHAMNQYSLSVKKLDFQFDEDTHRFASKYVYTLNDICCCFQNNKESLFTYNVPFGTIGSSLGCTVHDLVL